jgi:hypothetical protein
VAAVCRASCSHTGLLEQCLPLAVVRVETQRPADSVREDPVFFMPELSGVRALPFLDLTVLDEEFNELSRQADDASTCLRLRGPSHTAGTMPQKRIGPAGRPKPASLLHCRLRYGTASPRSTRRRSSATTSVLLAARSTSPSRATSSPPRPPKPPVSCSTTRSLSKLPAHRRSPSAQWRPPPPTDCSALMINPKAGSPRGRFADCKFRGVAACSEMNHPGAEW